MEVRSLTFVFIYSQFVFISQRWIHLAYTAGKQSKSYFLLKINHKTTKQASFSFLTALWTDKKHSLGIPPPQQLELGCSVWNPGGNAGFAFPSPLTWTATCLLTRTPVSLVFPKGQKQQLEGLLPTLDLVQMLPRLGLAQKRMRKGRRFERVIISHYISSPNAGPHSPGKQGTEFEGSESLRMSELMV